MPITPPLDQIPTIPSKGVSLLMNQINKQVATLIDEINKLTDFTVNLKDSSTCSDSDVNNAKNQLNKVLKQIAVVQELPTKIIPMYNSIKSVSVLAQAIKAAQLLNPVTAPAIIAAELLLVQNMTIANTIQATKQLEQIPNILKESLNGISVSLKTSLDTISNVCNIDNAEYELSKDLIDNFQDLPTEFYNEYNVSDSDIEDRLETIQQLVENQQNLLTSLQEAPSKVYEGTSIPLGEIGKPGDYFVDTKNRMIYGPKITLNEWPSAVNY